MSNANGEVMPISPQLKNVSVLIEFDKDFQESEWSDNQDLVPYLNENLVGQ